VRTGLFAVLFGSWFVLTQLGPAPEGHTNLLLLASCLLVLTPIVQGRHPFEN